jgi:CheY-like chemotaxis protein
MNRILAGVDILLVEDNPGDRDLVATDLEEAGPPVSEWKPITDSKTRRMYLI